MTLSFWVKSNKTGGASIDIGNKTQLLLARIFSNGYTINSANTWEYKTITIPGDTAGGNLTMITEPGYILIGGLTVVKTTLADISNNLGLSDHTTRNASNLGVGGTNK